MVEEKRQEQSDEEFVEDHKREYRKRSPTDFMLFLLGLKIPSSKGPTLFRDCIEDFQRETFESLAPSLYAIRNGTMPPRSRFWIERTKKAAKDADIAICLLWLLAFPIRPLLLQVGAADKDQASVARKRISDLVHFNPWLKDVVDIYQYKARSKNELAELEIVAADLSGSHGDTPDVLVLNELAHVTKKEFLENLMNNADGVPQGIAILATNAGFKGTWVEVWRTNALESKRWSIHFWSKPAPWHDEEALEDAKKRNSRSQYRRLWEGHWASGKGEALKEEDIDRCFSYGIKQITKPEDEWIYVAAYDLGISHDHSALVILGVNRENQRVRVAWLKAWEPAMEIDGGKQEVDLNSVEEACIWAHKTFHLEWFGYDPAAGGSFLAQRLRRLNLPMREVTFVAKNLNDMAVMLVQLVEEGRLECFDDSEGRLRRDFGKFDLIERASGLKLESVSDEYGHADAGTALVICLPHIKELLDRLVGWTGDEVLACEEEASEKEIEAMDSELKELYEAASERDDLWDERGRKSVRGWD
jgi:hypothetical protein